MWVVSGNDLKMTENDFGVALPITIKGVMLGDLDSLKFTFKDRMNGDTLLEKDFGGFGGNTVNLEFTEEESALFPVGVYVYRLDWYQDGNFMCNLIESALLRVGDKA